MNNISACGHNLMRRSNSLSRLTWQQQQQEESSARVKVVNVKFSIKIEITTNHFQGAFYCGTTENSLGSSLS